MKKILQFTSRMIISGILLYFAHKQVGSWALTTLLIFNVLGFEGMVSFINAQVKTNNEHFSLIEKITESFKLLMDKLLVKKP